jgi:hypothetical protein
MNKILRSALPMVAAAFVLTAFAATSEAAWPRYGVSAYHSLPSVPLQRPQFVPVYPNTATVPGVASYTQPAYAPPVVNVPGAMPPGGAPANYAPSLLAPPSVSVPNTTYYQPNYGTPTYGVPTYNAPAYNPAPITTGYTPYSYNTTPPYTAAPYNTVPQTSYYNPPAFQPYQQPRPIQPYVQPAQQYGGYYQPTRPSTFYSPTPSYYPQRPIFGQY